MSRVPDHLKVFNEKMRDSNLNSIIMFLYNNLP